MKKVVLHVLAMSSYSGAENVVCQIINMFSDDSDIKMIYCSPNGQIQTVLKDRGIEYEPMESLSLKELYRVIRKVKPDIIHAHDVRATVYSALCSGRIKLISHMHNNWENLRKTSIKAFAYQMGIKKASCIIWVSDSALRQYRYFEKVKNKSIVLKNIIDVDQIQKIASKNSTSKEYDIISVGRMTYQKNPQRLIGVIEKVAKADQGVKVAIVGDGELGEIVKSLVKSKKLEANIDILGYIDNPLGLVRTSKAFLMTSRWEGTPMVILEALALGVPVVGTPVDGMLELIENGMNGYLSTDDDEMARYLVDIIHDDDLRNIMSEQAIRRSAERNSKSDYKKVLNKIYKGAFS